jgi:hypothetical protein
VAGGNRTTERLARNLVLTGNQLLRRAAHPSHRIRNKVRALQEGELSRQADRQQEK